MDPLCEESMDLLSPRLIRSVLDNIGLDYIDGDHPPELQGVSPEASRSASRLEEEEEEEAASSESSEDDRRARTLRVAGASVGSAEVIARIEELLLHRATVVQRRTGGGGSMWVELSCASAVGECVARQRELNLGDGARLAHARKAIRMSSPQAPSPPPQ
eukprot:Hpha_TRINITY_DN15524_c3_g15::TRINITY_DN15524_c3_g15_i1::g.107974::m.107974